MGVKVIRANAEDQFLKQPGPASPDPEKKRKIIGRTFIDVFDAESTKLDNIKYLAQGTIYPDVIESGRRQERQGPRDQVPPQRGWPA